MSTNHEELLRTVDPAILGGRVRDARTARNFTQADVAGDDVTVSYISRIESGARRPNLKVLGTLASRLDVTLEQLLLGVNASEYDEIRLGLDYAELALESGEAVDAEHQARQHLERAEAALPSEMVDRARFLLARALESLGRLDEAIEEYETLLEAVSGLLAIDCGIALSRCYRESDDLTLAIEAGERVQATLAAACLENTDEAVRLSMTIAAAYAKRGDLARATRLANAAVRKAEELDSPAARAAAYWNASIFRADRGHVAEALPLASRALALLGEGQDARNLAILRRQLGQFQLEQEPPAVDDAISNLTQSRAELAASSGTQADLSECDTDLARAHLIAGEPERAAELATSALAGAPARAGIVGAEASIVLAHALDVLGETTAARQACQDAVQGLGHVDGMSRSAAQLWLELGDLLKSLGDEETAWLALGRSAAASGVKARPRARSRETITTASRVR